MKSRSPRKTISALRASRHYGILIHRLTVVAIEWRAFGALAPVLT
jgi:hypothetical protein